MQGTLAQLKMLEFIGLACSGMQKGACKVAPGHTWNEFRGHESQRNRVVTWGLHRNIVLLCYFIQGGSCVALFSLLCFSYSGVGEVTT